MKLENRVALVTGASKGIGKAIAVGLAGEGAKVILNYNSSGRQAMETVKEISSYGEALALKADVSDLKGIKDLFTEIDERFRRIDILVNNAGIYHRNDFFGSDESIWNQTMDTNLKSVYFCSRYAADYMVGQGSGSIINISSIAGIKKKYKRGIEYGLSKSGVNYLTRSLSLVLAPYNIRVNAIAPGHTKTEMIPYDLKEIEKDEIPLGRANNPEDIAKLAVFLASENASNITGQVISVDGGSVNL